MGKKYVAARGILSPRDRGPAEVELDIASYRADPGHACGSKPNNSLNKDDKQLEIMEQAGIGEHDRIEADSMEWRLNDANSAENISKALSQYDECERF